MSANEIYDPYIHTQSTAAAVWDIPHNQGRTVNVEFYDDSGNRVFPKEEEIDTNNYRGSFKVKGVAFAISGKAIVS